MTLLEIKKSLNSLLAGELLSMDMLKQHINFAIDEINCTMNSCFPTLGDVSDLTVEYTAIPDRYIRQVVLPGAAHHYYMVDDEGTTPEQDFARQFEAGRFYMLRDYSCMIPAEYQNDDINIGSVESEYEDYKGKRGVTVPDRDYSFGGFLW